MPAPPKITVIIPTFNQAGLLREALDSLRAQTEQGWEAEIVDNHSDDDSLDVVAGYGDQRLRVHSINNNGVIAASRNLALSQARGEWIAFLDSDDTWEPEKLSRSLEAIDRATDLVCHREYTVRDGEIIRCSAHRDNHWPSPRNLLFRGNCFSPSAVIVRKALVTDVGGFSEDPELVTCEDYDLWLKLAVAGMRAKFIPQILSSYRLHGANSHAAVEQHMLAGLEAVRRHYDALAPRRPLDPLRLQRRQAEIIYAAGRSYQHQGNRGKALRKFWQSILTFPVYPKSYAGLAFAFLGIDR